MAIQFKIYPRLGLVYVQYSGNVRMEETVQAFADYAAHLDFRYGQKHLVDLSQVTSYEKDYVRVMSLQADKAAVLMQEPVQTMIVYLAPTRTSYEIARLAANAWDEVPTIVACVQESEAEALSVLGYSYTRLADLLEFAESTVRQDRIR